MIRLTASLLLLLIATITVAQNPASSEVKTADGRTVVLKGDGTWEYKKDTPPPSPAPGLPNTETSALSPNFSGHDAGTLLIQLVGLRKRLIKSEFETTADYGTRTAEEKKKSILNNLTIHDTFYLVASGVEADYDADSQSMKFFLPVEKNTLVEAFARLNRLEDKKNIRDLSRISLYSVSLGGGYDADEVFFNDTNGLPLSKKSYREGFSANMHVNVEEAKRLKNAVKAVLLVQFEEPYAVDTYSSKGQFQTRLIDVQFFDQQAGRVLVKMGTAPTPTLTPAPPLTPKPASVGKNALLNRAQELYNARLDAEALAEVNRLVRIEPTNAEAYLLAGRIHLQRDDQEASIAALKTSLFWGPKLIDAHILLGRIFLARGDRAEAKKHASAALTLDPNNQEALSLQRQISR